MVVGCNDLGVWLCEIPPGNERFRVDGRKGAAPPQRRKTFPAVQRTTGRDGGLPSHSHFSAVSYLCDCYIRARRSLPDKNDQLV